MNTQYITWDRECGYQGKELARAAEILRRGGLVAFPTETVYGLGGNGLLASAAEKIYAAKGRPSDNPLILHISSQEELFPLVREVSDTGKRLMEAFWPGPMTLIFEKTDRVPLETTGGLDTVAIRMPEHPGARELIACAGVPVAAPSANISGRPSPTSAEHVREDLDGRIDLIIDGGNVGIGLESTIIDLTETVPVILRPGAVTSAMIAEVIGEVRLDAGLAGKDSLEPPKAPGMKYRHYAPEAAMTIIEGEMETVIERINQLAGDYPADKVGILAAEETKERYPHGQVVTVGSRTAGTIGKGLYRALRTFDHLGVEVIFSETFSGERDSEAIMNRLKKAAGYHVEILPGK
ncbi:MAG: threonylcarbamoyl-AMP synthase [Lachnospiraceae bacterium]|nr:threonylcarbamoyl-AMP synthase [Lachnospiraceae bacterium]